MALTRTIRAGGVTTTVGQTITVPIQLESQGDEASASFTLNFNPAVLTYVSAAVGTGVPAGTNLALNATQAAQGRLGVLLDSTNTYAAGTRQILTVTFTVAANAAAGSYPISFGSTPTTQSVSNAQGVLLTTAYEAGNVLLGTTAAGVEISGRVVNVNGSGIRGVTVSLTDADGVRQTATTNSFGFYTFADVAVGQSIVVGVNSRRYRFAPKVINVTDTLTGVDFQALE